ncbi:Rieske 2Fe-2S domain-containing protein [Cupriavidus pauculus]|uniref:Rieske 2Fe-2S domain-containing protein n=1 Tax=Cupriavidus pauculus TaxID=82633 RepID=A0A5P2HFK2_9BURK|nr:Rieske 2Fe-2S domain-containing protein [Cupriavidus pauculus]QET06384.1 Rieske 2Fe-2S domain-containing protein [Cupriavidus pauculus]
MTTADENELLTRVENGAPMGRMLRQLYWMPAVLSSRLEADGAPVRVRLFGENFVAFRATDGRIGFLDEACPHRGVSLALGRNEDCAIRCIFHGWKISVTGDVLEVPNEASNPDCFRDTVKVRHFPTVEGAGIVWVWLGEEGEAPPPPNFEWMNLPATQAYACGIELNANWLQGVEATIDSSHIALLHQSWLESSPTDMAATRVNSAVRYQFENTDYGIRAAALREAPDGSCVARVTEFVMPYYGLIPPIGIGAAQDRTVIIAVPIDDTHLIQWYIYYNTERPVDSMKRTQRANTWPMAGGMPGGPEQNWGQNRTLMQHGNHTGFHEIVIEDFVTQVSMGPIVDRTKEYLCSADQAIIRVRRQLLDAVRRYTGGVLPASATPQGRDHAAIRATGGRMESAEQDWRALPR